MPDLLLQRLVRRAVLPHQLHPDHQAEAAYFSDRRRPLLQVAQPPDELRPLVRGIGQDVLARKDVQGRDPGGARYRIAAEGRAVRGRLPLVHQPPAGDHGAQRQARGNRLGQRHDVGDHSGLLAGKHLARPPIARLHLVGDQQDAMLVAELTQTRHEIGGRDHVAALSQDRLDDEGGDVPRRHPRVEHLVDEVEDIIERRRVARPGRISVRIRVGHVIHARQERLVALPVVALGRGQRERTVRPSMKRALKGDQRGPAGHVTGQLDRPLHRFGTAVGEEDLVELARGEVRDPFRQLNGRLVVSDH